MSGDIQGLIVFLGGFADVLYHIFGKQNVKLVIAKYFFDSIFQTISLHEFLEMRFLFHQRIYAEDERIVIS